MTVPSDVGDVGDQVTLLSPMTTITESTELHFKYHIWTSSEDKTAALSVLTYSQLRVHEEHLFEIQDNRGTSWQQATACLPNGTYQLAFVATHGLRFSSDIAVDNIVLSTDTRCSLNTTNKGRYFTGYTPCEFGHDATGQMPPDKIPQRKNNPGQNTTVLYFVSKMPRGSRTLFKTKMLPNVGLSEMGELAADRITE